MKHFFLLSMILASNLLNASCLTSFTLTFEKDRVDTPVSVTLEGLNYNTDMGNLLLVDASNDHEKIIPCQLESGHSARLWFIVEGDISKGSIRKYILRTIVPGHSNSGMVYLEKDHKDLCLKVDDQSVLKYRYAVTMPPKGANPLYQRSGYIHPLYSPGGQILTRIQPKDHYHHYGIWGPWTKTHIDGREVDFWNLKKGQGTVRFAGFISEVQGPVFSGFQSLQQHVDFGAKEGEEVAINEVLDVRVWNTQSRVHVIDYTTTLNCPLPHGIMLDAYRYGGGIGFRATESWHKDNCSVLTSEGRTRLNADGSNARWCIVEGDSDVETGRSGILFLSHPSNRIHPEPMRVWPFDGNQGRGDMYFEFVPIRYDDWKLNPNENHTLKYRMIVFDGTMDAKTAEKYWNSFSKSPKVEIHY